MLTTVKKVGAEIGGAICVGLDGLNGLAGEGLCTARSSKTGGELGKNVAGRLTTRPDNNPGRIRYYGDPLPVFGFNATTVMPSLGFRMTHPTHTYK